MIKIEYRNIFGMDLIDRMEERCECGELDFYSDDFPSWSFNKQVFVVEYDEKNGYHEYVVDLIDSVLERI
jgi:hypothetical protein